VSEICGTLREALGDNFYLIHDLDFGAETSITLSSLGRSVYGRDEG